MAIINPIHLNKWLPGTTILSSEAKAEFLNLYELVNGKLDATNIKNGGITGIKLTDNSITNSKISSLDASKLTGVISTSNLPANILTTTGGTLTNTIVFDVTPSTPLLKNYDNEEVILYEGGTGTSKIKIVVGGISVMKIILGDKVLWELTSDGTEIPLKFKVPME